MLCCYKPRSHVQRLPLSLPPPPAPPSYQTLNPRTTLMKLGTVSAISYALSGIDLGGLWSCLRYLLRAV
eukprot:724286-Rhodomonas_salina.1